MAKGKENADVRALLREIFRQKKRLAKGYGKR